MKSRKIEGFMNAFAVFLIAISLSTVLSSRLSHASHKPRAAVRHDVELIVHTAALGLGGMLSHVPSKQDQFEIIRNFVAPVSVFPDKSGYLFVFRMDGLCIAHGKKASLQGQNLIDYKTVNGTAIFRAMIDMIRENDHGFIEYNWPKPNHPGNFLKLGYMERIPGTDYFLGSGIYYPTHTQPISSYLH